LISFKNIYSISLSGYETKEEKTKAQLSLIISSCTTRIIVVKLYKKLPLYSLFLFLSAEEVILSHFTIKLQHTLFLYHSLFSSLFNAESKSTEKINRTKFSLTKNSREIYYRY
jgi:hypothetical protein